MSRFESGCRRFTEMYPNWKKDLPRKMKRPLPAVGGKVRKRPLPAVGGKVRKRPLPAVGGKVRKRPLPVVGGKVRKRPLPVVGGKVQTGRVTDVGVQSLRSAPGLHFVSVGPKRCPLGIRTGAKRSSTGASAPLQGALMRS